MYESAKVKATDLVIEIFTDGSDRSYFYEISDKVLGLFHTAIGRKHMKRFMDGEGRLLGVNHVDTFNFSGDFRRLRKINIVGEQVWWNRYMHIVYEKANHNFMGNVAIREAMRTGQDGQDYQLPEEHPTNVRINYLSS